MDSRFLISGLIINLGGFFVHFELSWIIYHPSWGLLGLLNLSVWILLGFFLAGLVSVVYGLTRSGSVTINGAKALTLGSFVLGAFFSIVGFGSVFSYGNTAAACGGGPPGVRWWASPTDLGPDRCDVWAVTPNFAFLDKVYGVAVLTMFIIFGSSLLVLRKNSPEG